jgi:hypothetical protein
LTDKINPDLKARIKLSQYFDPGLKPRIHPALRQGKTAKIPVSARFPAAKNHMVEFPINYSGQVEMKAHRADLQIFYTANPPIPVRKKHDNCKTLE